MAVWYCSHLSYEATLQTRAPMQARSCLRVCGQLRHRAPGGLTEWRPVDRARGPRPSPATAVHWLSTPWAAVPPPRRPAGLHPRLARKGSARSPQTPLPLAADPAPVRFRTLLLDSASACPTPDLLVAIMCLPFTFVYTLMDHWVFGEAMCKLNPFVQCVSITVSIFSLVLIAVERHQLIINPRGWRPSNRHAYIGIAVIWVLAVVSSLPFLIYQVLTDEPFQNVTLDAFKDKYVCFDKFPSDSHRLSYTTLLLMLQYFGPLCFIFICYFKIYIRLKRRNNMMDKMRDNKYRSSETKRINIMLLSIVVAFAVCWLPLTIFNTVFDWNHQIIATCNHNLLFLLCHLTAMISTCVNPIFYGFLNKNFQRDLQFFFSFCDFRSRDDDYETIAMSTMHTDVSKTSLKQASPVAFKKINNDDNEKI
ncbi:neuropeptide Y receptor type 1 isoform X1 [Mirounga angustirostris]|uniref:neuropeptide Y receptor type 1 isoform X1 n=1 Tax=Mirounga angustirostris TaxID=9716 RepID=UPI00313F1C6F